MLKFQICLVVNVLTVLPSWVYLGDRTFGVLTKLDLMDKGTNALEVMAVFHLLCFLRFFVDIMDELCMNIEGSRRKVVQITASLGWNS